MHYHRGRKPFQPQAKDTLHLLFVVSRPSDASFIDPRADPQRATVYPPQGAPVGPDNSLVRVLMGGLPYG